MSIKNRFRTFLAVSICLLATTSVVHAQYSGGTGEPNDPYQIATAADLIALGETPDDYDKHFILNADIDLDPNLPGGRVFDQALIAPDDDSTTYGWFDGDPFTGVFDGKGHVISHPTIKGNSYLGLFGRLDGGAMISNLGLEALDISGTGNFVGGVVGINGWEGWGGYGGGGRIINCSSRGKVSGESDVGGLVGRNCEGSIASSYCTGTVAGNESVGGLIGSNAGRIVMSYSTAAVEGVLDVGGLVGENTLIRAREEDDVRSRGSIYASYSTGTVSGDSRVGGLTGSSSYYSDIVESHSSSTVAGYEDVGGLAGYNRGYITMCYSTGVISGNVNVGGLTGNTHGRITNCYSIASVSGLTNVAGGLAGLNHGYLRDCYARNEVTGNERVGGLVGMNHREVTRCYCAGSVAGDLAVGGLVGSNVFSDTSEIVGCFWDAQDSGLSTMCGLGIGDDAGGRTMAEMQSTGTFLDAGWDFVDETENGSNDIWKIVEGQTYPLLSWQKYGGGTGEPNDPYLIYTAEHLNALGAEPNDYDKHFKLMADIDLSGHSYERALIAADMNDDEIGWPGTPFTGVFDGNGHTISHLTITGASYLGLFGQLDQGGAITDLALDMVDVNGTGSRIGAIAGSNKWGRIATSHSTGTVAGDTCVGGLVGGNNGTISACYSVGSVSGRVEAGGLVGLNNGTISACYSVGSVSGHVEAGGLVGGNRGTISACFWDTETSGQTTSDGGTGLTTAEMQTASTFLEAGWDFIEETENGTDDIWWILGGQDYPRLWWELAESPEN